MVIDYLKVPYLISSFEEHSIIKEDILNLINNSPAESSISNDEKKGDRISRLDWNHRTKFDREWVKRFLPLLHKNIQTMIQQIGFSNHEVIFLWFQQYLQNGTHGWHIHADNYTGVYYLELPVGTPTTEYCNPNNMNEVNKFNVKEGDILLFPSFVVHKAIKNLSDKRKTIISFNIKKVRGHRND